MIRIRRAREPAEHRRQQLTLNLGLPRDTLAECCYVAQRGCWVGITKRLQPVQSRVRSQPELLGRNLGDRVKQRRIEEPLMEPTYPLRGVTPRAEESVHRILVSERTSQPAKIMIIVRQQVGTPKVVELDAMFECAEEPVGQGEPFAVLAADVAVVDQGLQCWQGGSRPQWLIHSAVHQLQQLDRELDIA